MTLEKSVKNAYGQSVEGTRRGDTFAELEEIKEYIKNSKQIVVPNWNKAKIEVINQVLDEFGLSPAQHLEFHTNSCDLTRMPALTKAIMALDISSCDLVIARGRLGVPGSGSLLVILDKKGRLLSAALSPAHVIHGKSVSEAVKDEITAALERVGLEKK